MPLKVISVDFSALKKIDEHAMFTPEKVSSSPESLAAHLSIVAKTGIEKVRAIYKWITRNVSYDVSALCDFSKRLPNDAESVLRNKECVCEGYACLMKKLCELMEIECEYIVGYSKGDSSDSANFKINELHAWNAVKLDGEWKLIDCTWGGGYVENNARFLRRETDFFFLTDPNIFVEDHLPCIEFNIEASKKWQLLEDPIDVHTFVERPSRRRGCFEHSVELVSHAKQALIEVNGEVTLKFRGTGKPLTLFKAKFVDPNTGNRISDGKHIATVLNRAANEATVTARTPTTDKDWELQIFGTTVENATSSDCLVSYRLRSVAFNNRSAFPNLDGHYGLGQDPQNFGFPKNFCDKQNFWLRVESSEYELKIPLPSPTAATASIKFADDSEPNKNLLALEINDNFLIVHLRLNRVGFYILTIYFRESDADESDQQLTARFLIECPKLRRDAGTREFPDSQAFYGFILDPEAFGLQRLEEQQFYVKPEGGEHEIKFPLSRPLRGAASVKVSFGARGEPAKQSPCIFQVTSEMIVVSLLMDRSGFYIVELYCDDFELKKCVARLLIECTNPSSKTRRLPNSDEYEFYGIYNDPENFGFEKDLKELKTYWLKPESGQYELKFPISDDFAAKVSVEMKFSADEETNLKSSALEVTDRFVCINLLLKCKGFYELKLFCTDDGFIKLVARFLIECTKPLRDPWKFPELDGYYGVYANPERFGFSRNFCTDRRFHIKAEVGKLEFRIPINRCIFAKTKLKSGESCANNDNMSFVELDDRSMKISLRMVEAGFHKLELWCERIGSREAHKDGLTMERVAIFLIECFNPLEKRRPFPEWSFGASDERVLLLEPRDGELPRNTEVEFKLASSSLKRVEVQQQLFERNGEEFSARIKTGFEPQEICLFGASDEHARSLSLLFKFYVL